MRVLLDTNILLRSVEPQHSMYSQAEAAVSALLASEDEPVLVSQNLYEFWVVSTRPLSQNGLGLSAIPAASELAKFKSEFSLYDDTPAIRPVWERLVAKYQVIGKNAHDARLVAAMIVHGIGRILTFNVADFQRYQEIETLAPGEVLKPLPNGTT